jgi:hypothetical protein
MRSVILERLPVNVFYISDCIAGGWPTFVGHLIRGLRAVGADPTLFRISNRTELTRWREFGRGLQCHNIRAEDTVNVVKESASILAALAPKMSEIGKGIIDAGALWVIHDPGELRLLAVRELFDFCHIEPVVIRKNNLRHVPNAVYIPHPYQRIFNEYPTERLWSCVSYSRIDWDKHTELIAQANVQLDEAIRIYGYIGRPFAHSCLDKDYQGWRVNYYGEMAKFDLWAGAWLARNAKYVVDMSTIKGDGGGTQYTFLEAWDAGARLILNRKWLVRDSDRDEVVGAAHFVDDSDGLVEMLRDGSLDWHAQTIAAEKILMEHDAERIGKMYLDMLFE